MRTIGLGLVLTIPSVASAQVRTLPTQPATVAAARIGIDVYLVNEGPVEAVVDTPATIAVTTEDGTPVTLSRQGEVAATIAAGGFAKLRYAAAPTMAAAVPTETIAQPAVGTSAAFAGRFEPFQPIYGVFGTGDAGAKLQVSFAFRPFEDAGALDGLRFAWTQTMFWAIDQPSGPFRSTNYAPEIYYIRPLSDDLSVSAGYRHDSNGRGDPGSIDVNRIYARIAKHWELGEEWYAEIAPQAWFYVGRQGAAPDLDRYWGYTAVNAAIGQRDGIRVALDLRGNPATARGAGEMFLSYPLARITGGLGIYAFGQGFTGYGEAIDDYATARTDVRFGIALTR